MDLPVADLSPWFILGFAFLFGTAWGSFFNVCIYRWPREMSVVSPPSACPHCGTPVRGRDNIPVLGWLLLRGRTRCCDQPLSGRYALVEFITGLLLVALAQRYMVHAPPGTTVLHATIVTGVYFAFVGGLLVATFVDLEFMEIPDEVSLPGAALGLATASLRAAEPEAIADLALGAGGAYLVVQLVFVWSYEHLTGRRGMGEGDAKLMLMIGAFTGWQGALFAVVAGSLQGILVAAFAMLTGRELGPSGDLEELERIRAENAGEPWPEPAAAPEALPDAAPPLEAPGADAPALDPGFEDDEPPPAYFGHLKTPFGPFLALGALEYLFFGDALVAWWLGLLGA